MGHSNRFDPVFSLVAGDGSAVKSEPSITSPTGGAAELPKITRSASAMEQNSRWTRVRDKVKVRWMKTWDTVHSTLSLHKSKTSNIKSESTFSQELQSAKASLSCNQKIWELSLLRKSGKTAAFTLDHCRARKVFRGGWCKDTRPSQAGRRRRSATRRVGPKKAAREKEVLAWSSLVVARAASQKVQLRARANLEQQELRTRCQDVDSMATLLLFYFSAGAIRAWPEQAQRLQDTTARSTACARWTPVPWLGNLSQDKKRCQSLVKCVRPSNQELNIEVEGVSDILVGANGFQVEVIDVTEECTPEFHLIWLEMMAEQPNIRMFGVPRMQNMWTGAHWGMSEGLQSLMDVVMVMDGPNTEGFDQIRSEGAPMRNSDFASNGHPRGPKYQNIGTSSNRVLLKAPRVQHCERVHQRSRIWKGKLQL